MLRLYPSPSRQDGRVKGYGRSRRVGYVAAVSQDGDEGGPGRVEGGHLCRIRLRGAGRQRLS